MTGTWMIGHLLGTTLLGTLATSESLRYPVLVVVIVEMNLPRAHRQVLEADAAIPSNRPALIARCFSLLGRHERRTPTTED